MLFLQLRYYTEKFSFCQYFYSIILKDFFVFAKSFTKSMRKKVETKIFHLCFVQIFWYLITRSFIMLQVTHLSIFLAFCFTS